MMKALPVLVLFAIVVALALSYLPLSLILLLWVPGLLAGIYDLYHKRGLPFDAKLPGNVSRLNGRKI